MHILKNIKNTLHMIRSLSTASCVSMPKERDGQNKFSHQSYKDELALQNIKSYEIGLALSGGGLRSSLFSYGVLKALYDEGILDKVDVVSSVSGGGYTAYGLFTSKDQKHFGDSIFKIDNYLEETCKLITTGNFVTFRKMLGAVCSLNQKKEAIALYHTSIGRTYGKNDQNEPLMRMDDLIAPIKANEKPFLIINTTVSNPEASGWADGLFEFTPLWMGNDRYGYKKWTQDEGFELRQAIAISGAAFAPLLEQTISVSLPEYPKNTITLSDGGHSENLVVVALVKRGVKNIIVIDAEHDPNYAFSSYKNLKCRLSAFNAKLSIESLDSTIKEKSRLKNGLHVGKVITEFKEEVKISNILYLKMSMPASLDRVVRDGEMNKKGRDININYFQVLKQSKDQDGNWDCSVVRDSNIDLKSWYAFNIASYSKYLNCENYVKYADRLPGEFFTAKFPQYTTVDQSFYLDQALAFIGLGYWEAQELTQNSDIGTGSV